MLGDCCKPLVTSFYLISYLYSTAHLHICTPARPSCHRAEPETGSICDIVVREHVTLHGALHRCGLIKDWADIVVVD